MVDETTISKVTAPMMLKIGTVLLKNTNSWLPRWGTNAASFGNRIGQTRNAKVLFSNTSAAHWSRRTTHQSTTTPPRNNRLTRQRNRRSWQSSEICPHGWVILFIASTILRLWRKKRLILWRDRQAMRLEWYDQSVWISALQAHPINNTHWYLCSGRQRFNHQRLWKTDPLKFLVTRPFEVSGYQTLWSFWPLKFLVTSHKKVQGSNWRNWMWRPEMEVCIILLCVKQFRCPDCSTTWLTGFVIGGRVKNSVPMPSEEAHCLPVLRDVTRRLFILQSAVNNT